MVKKIVILLLLACLPLAGGFLWLAELFEPGTASINIEQTSPEDLPYVTGGAPKSASAKILAVVTSTQSLGDSGLDTGYEHTELARAYYVFQANGFTVDIASPLGGEPPAIFDTEDMGAYDYAFLNDQEAMRKVTNSIPLAQVHADVYQGIYFVGGKGAMFDYPR
ncbi:hypothetical protein QWI17_17135 [Gilvimarinus sp. SDUM040013]|uniref:DJ-1/PfpI domain-containing protein n=1 Tax=Gilvimarinus gilvus TaxID=3058038 RepID=A0ABU4RZ27_9GAMM|nr:hypothetical protein [Gilvimarinus sp. SDUM040013]MDO3387570.1 hypothetical protein [Gilvimarinus sp. SDUM040013]MDX6850165.1 hypothetical protein [Gilvimarinus sp. SDUM040013]